MDYFLLFIEGIMTFLSPCLLPMVPIYLAYFAGDGEAKSVKQTIAKALLFVLGFSTVFILMSLFVSTIGAFVTRNQQIINIIAGLMIVLIGIDYLTGQKISNRINFKRFGQGKVANPYVFGLVFAVSWTPCVGAFLASALTYILTIQSSLQSFLLISAYCVGLGIPFIFSAVLVEESKQVFDFIKKHYGIINKISGVFLIIFGLLMMTGIMQRALIWLT